MNESDNIANVEHQDCKGQINQQNKSADIMTVESSTSQRNAWQMCAATFLWIFLQSGLLKSYGVLYLEFLEIFGGGATKTDLMGFFFGINECIFSMLGGYIGSHKYKRLVIIGTGMITAGLCIATGMAPSLDMAIITFGLLGGCIAVIYPPLYGSLGMHFTDKRYLAYAIAVSGDSVGSLIFPIAINIMVEEYSIRGAMIIIGGFMLHACVCGAMIFKPVSSHMEDSLNAGSGPGEQVSQLDSVSTISQSIDVTLQQKDENERSGEMSKHVALFGTETNDNTKDRFPFSENQNTELKFNKNVIDAKCINIKEGDQLQLMPYKKLFCNLEVQTLTLVCLLCFLGAVGILIVIPSVAEEIGVSKVTTSLILIVYSVIELFARPIIGLASDRSELVRSQLFPCMQMILGSSSIVIYFYPSQTTLTILAVLVGLLGTSFFGFMGPLYSDAVGAHNGTRTSGFMAFTGGLYFVVLLPIKGTIKDSFDTYLPCLLFCGCCCIIASAILWIRCYYKSARHNNSYQVHTVKFKAHIIENYDDSRHINSLALNQIRPVKAYADQTLPHHTP